jgi:hypothetical protein
VAALLETVTTDPTKAAAAVVAAIKADPTNGAALYAALQAQIKAENNGTVPASFADMEAAASSAINAAEDTGDMDGTDSANNNASRGGVAGIVVTVVLLLALAVGAMYYFKNKANAERGAASAGRGTADAHANPVYGAPNNGFGENGSRQSGQSNGSQYSTRSRRASEFSTGEFVPHDGYVSDAPADYASPVGFQKERRISSTSLC